MTFFSKKVRGVTPNKVAIRAHGRGLVGGWEGGWLKGAFAPLLGR